MSKALSANIHDPNHTVEEYDLYFNGEPIETGGSLHTINKRYRPQEETGNTFMIDFEEEIPSNAVITLENKTLSAVAGLVLSCNSADNAGIYMPTQTTVGSLGFTFEISGSVVRITAASASAKFIKNNLYSVNAIFIKEV